MNSFYWYVGFIKIKFGRNVGNGGGNERFGGFLFFNGNKGNGGKGEVGGKGDKNDLKSSREENIVGGRGGFNLGGNELGFGLGF